MVNSTDTVDQHELAFHEMPKPVVQALVLREPAVTTQIKFVALVFERCGESANVSVPLEHGNANSVRTQLVGSRQSSRACAENDDLLGTGYWTSPLRRYRVTAL